MLVEIEDNDELYRRIFPEYVRANGTVSLKAFMLSGYPDPQVSVDLARLTTPEEAVSRAKEPGYGLGAIVAQLPRSLGLTVRHDPIPNHYSHSLIIGENTKEKCKRLAEGVRLMIQPKRMAD